MSQVKKTSSRIIALDLLRGYFLIAILFDHLQYFPNGLDWLSGRGSLYVSAAEGFFFISGIVLGVVRGRKLIDKPFKFAAKLLLQRAVQIYITAVVLFFIFTFIGWQFMGNPGLKPGIRPPDESFWTILINALNFNYIYGWADYLRLYAVYMFVSPLVMWLLRKGKWYIALIGSLIVWYCYNFSQLESPELSQVFSWQLIFFGGMIIGFYLQPIRDWWNSLSETARRAIIIPTVGITIVTMSLNMIFVIYGEYHFSKQLFDYISTNISPLFNKEQLPLTRVSLFLIWFGASFWAMIKLEKYVLKWFGWILIPFGTNSLYVYTIQAFLIFFAHLLVAPHLGGNTVYNLLLTIIYLALTWLAVRTRFLMKIIPR